jgi:hypothetical protein
MTPPTLALWADVSHSTISYDLLKLGLTLVASTGCGAFLAYFFQRLQAKSQWLRSRGEKELEEAQAAFEEVSRLLDRRLYRARRLLWKLHDQPEVRDERLADYSKVVIKWNENINRILALLAIHFTDGVRDALDYSIGKQFRTIGQSLEDDVKGESQVDSERLEQDLNKLADDIYAFNLTLLEHIRQRRNLVSKEL